ncbi:MAG: hypothetical protein IJM54_10700 [Thermoguttaceae bacterium]|nr:hypothetical protein [Thermoguttaceae bacterium]
MSASDNYYLMLECFLDPPELNWPKLEAHIKAKRDEWNKKRNNPNGTVYQRLSERIDEATDALKEQVVRKKQADEARKLKLSELDARIAACSAGGAIAPEQIQLLLDKFSPFFQPGTIRGRIKVPETSENVVLPPPKKVENAEAALFAPKMKKTSECLQVLGKETVYEALGLVRTSSVAELRRASEELGDKGQKASKKTAETNAQKELGGLAKEFFQDEASKRAFEAAWARFQFSEKLIEIFDYRVIQRKTGTKTEKFVTEKNYEISLQDAIKAGMRRDEAEWFVYDFYVLKRKCRDPRVDRSREDSPEKVYCPNCFAANERSANKCVSCGYSLKTTCPKCGKTSALVERCPSCGFSFVDMENASLLTDEAKNAFAEKRLDDAIAAFRRAQSFWSGAPGLGALGEKLRDAHAEREYRLFQEDVDSGRTEEAKRRLLNFSFDGATSAKGRELRRLADEKLETIDKTAKGAVELEELCQKNRFFQAKQKYAELLSLGYDDEGLKAILQRIESGMERARVELDAIETASDREKKLADLLARFPDFEEARNLLKTQDVASVPKVDAFDRGNGIEVCWSRSPSLGDVFYRVLRSELRFASAGVQKTAPTVLKEGVSELSYRDETAEEFNVYVYSIVACRSSSSESSATSAAPVVRVGKARGVQITPDSKKLSVSWRVSPNARRIEVKRQDLSNPQAPPAPVANVGRDGFVDFGLVDGNEYLYSVTLYYTDAFGKEQSAPVQQFRGVPDEPPKALDDWRGAYSQGKIELTWKRPSEGDVYFFESTKPFGIKPGAFFTGSIAELSQKFGAPIELRESTDGTTSRARFSVTKGASESKRHVLPVTVVGKIVAIGRERAIDFLESASGLMAQLVDDDVYITWNWSYGVKKCLVLYSDKRPPSGLADQNCGRLFLTKQEYDRENAWVRLGQGTRPFFVTVAQVYENEGKERYSKPSTLFTEKLFVSYRFFKREIMLGLVSDSGFGRALYKAGIWNALKLIIKPKEHRFVWIEPMGNRTKTPEMIIVKRVDRLPYRRDDGEIVARIPASNDAPFEFSMDDVVAPGQRDYFSLYCANIADSRIFALIEEK